MHGPPQLGACLQHYFIMCCILTATAQAPRSLLVFSLHGILAHRILLPAHWCPTVNLKRLWHVSTHSVHLLRILGIGMAACVALLLTNADRTGIVVSRAFLVRSALQYPDEQNTHRSPGHVRHHQTPWGRRCAYRHKPCFAGRHRQPAARHPQNGLVALLCRGVFHCWAHHPCVGNASRLGVQVASLLCGYSAYANHGVPDTSVSDLPGIRVWHVFEWVCGFWPRFNTSDPSASKPVLFIRSLYMFYCACHNSYNEMGPPAHRCPLS